MPLVMIPILEFRDMEAWLSWAQAACLSPSTWSCYSSLWWTILSKHFILRSGKSSDASQSEIENEEINWVACPLIFQTNPWSYECPRSHRGMLNYRAGSFNSQSTVLFKNVSLWHVILYRTENQSKTRWEAGILNTVALWERNINIAWTPGITERPWILRAWTDLAKRKTS